MYLAMFPPTAASRTYQAIQLETPDVSLLQVADLAFHAFAVGDLLARVMNDALVLGGIGRVVNTPQPWIFERRFSIIGKNVLRREVLRADVRLVTCDVLVLRALPTKHSTLHVTSCTFARCT